MYRLDGWFEDSALKTPYDFSQPVMKDLTLYAGWKALDVVDVTVGGYNAAYDGRPHGLSVDAGGADVTVYYATEALNGDNYLTKGKTEPITRAEAGVTTVYWYIRAESCAPKPDSGSAKIEITRAAMDAGRLTDAQKPTAKADLRANGAEQALLNAPKNLPDGYTAVQYSADDGRTWKSDIPTASAAGSYTVRVKYVGDVNHADFEGAAVAVTMAKAEETPATPSTPAAPSAPSAPEAPAGPTIYTIYAPRKSSKATIEVGSLYQIDLGGAVGSKYRSSRGSVATVDQNDLVTPLKAGKAKITLKAGKKKRTITLKVVDPTVPTSVVISASGPLTGRKGETVQLTASVPEGTNSAIRWTSSNKKVATVDQNGLVTFRKPGKARITATAVRGKKKARVTVKAVK